MSNSLWPHGLSIPGFPIPHNLPEFAQVHVHCISSANQPSHPLMPSSPSWITALSWWMGLHNLMKLWAMPCRATQDRQVIAESSDKTWSTGGGNGKSTQYTCHENLMNCIKGKKNIWGLITIKLQPLPMVNPREPRMWKQTNKQRILAPNSWNTYQRSDFSECRFLHLPT